MSQADEDFDRNYWYYWREEDDYVDDDPPESDDHTEDAGCWCGGGCDPLNT